MQVELRFDKVVGFLREAEVAWIRRLPRPEHRRRLGSSSSAATEVLREATSSAGKVLLRWAQAHLHGWSSSAGPSTPA